MRGFSVALKLYNTMGRKMEDFKPINESEVGLYGCGPTVYNFAHIGNLKTYVFEDLLRRTLEYLGYNVKHVMNITDVGHLTDDADEGEDKMEKSAREKGKTVWEIAEYFTDAFFKDTEKLNILNPHISCRATEHIEEMINLIKTLEDKGFTYESGGNIYFSIDNFPDYGKLALLDRQKLSAGARIEIDSNKKNPHDFVLWFTNSKFENHAMLWDSPWGKGYPGWHVECSAMSMKYLGEQFDIHCGGIDHVNIHHTNEIAQTEAATGKKWVNYWLHGEFLVMNKAKMAKSAGNFLTLSTLGEKGYAPLDYRYFCLGGHYRSQLQFSWESLDSAKTARNNLVEKVRSWMQSGEKTTLDSISSKGKKYFEDFRNSISEDLNMPKALAVVWILLKDKELSDSEKLALVLDFDRVMGLDLERSAETKDNEAENVDQKVFDLIKEREEARKVKDFARSDEIRNLLKEMGIEIKDTAVGTNWKKL